MEDHDRQLRFNVIEANGISLHYAEAGPKDGRLAILLHGFPEAWFAWRGVMAALAARDYRVVAPDQRGYNLSSKPSSFSAYALDALAADIFALANRLGGGTFDLIGHDWGATVAWRMATIDPARLRHMVILNAPHPAIWLEAQKRDPEQHRKSRYVGFFRLPWLPELVLKARNYAALAQAFASSPRRDAFSDDVMEQYRESWRQPGALSGMLNWYRALLHFRIDLPPPSSIAVPTLILWGDKDDFAEPSLAEASARLCADVRVRHFPDATHWLVHDQPDDVAQEIGDFLRTGPCS